MPKRKDIVIVRITTVPQSLWKLLEGQLGFINQYYEVHGISSPGEKLEIVKERENIDVHGISMYRGISPYSDIRSIIGLIRLFRQIRPTVVHTHTPKAGLVGMIAAWICRVPVRMHTVAGMPLESRSGFSRKILLWAEKLTYRFAGNVYPNSRGIAEVIRINQLAPVSKIKMIGHGSSNGIDIAHFDRSVSIETKAESIREDLNIGSDATVFGFIGRLVKDKGIVELISAYNKISSAQDCHLVLVGKYEQELDPLPAEIISEIENNRTIHFVGYQNDVRPYFASFDVFVFPSYREGLPNVLLQAGAMGLPIIASDCTGNTDIIYHKENGLLVKVGEVDELFSSIELLLSDSVMRYEYARNVKEYVRLNYDRKMLWELIKEEYESLLNE